ncbi:hypothetical protein FE374_17795 [Georgenia yuyongxinii]|uniref:Leucine rich repeat variant domain-containing protein n=1 Tax=Georgenia yuyongxinii TaxID=2589797 RepID=A0A5B8CAE7_9MICO|nr:hypothetical protein [Georgenia yuyongxinii]QDC26212.1 hypothetical protein FE374_17795 [Georgenia yuyongxinii]
MPAPEQLTAYDASNPATPPELLAAIAAQRPDLRALVATNPATSSDVLGHLARLGDVAVDAALARRTGAPGVAPIPYPPAGGPFVAPTGAGYGHSAPANPYTAGSVHAAAADPYQTGPAFIPGATGPAPGATGHAPGETGYAPGAAGFAPGVAGYAPSTSTYAGAAPWEPTKKRSWLPWIIVGAVAVIVACVIAVAALVSARVDDFAPTFDPSVDGYGSDPALDAFWDGCTAGDGAACDDLFWQSPADSEYEEFGNTCGGRFEYGPFSCDGKI